MANSCSATFYVLAEKRKTNCRVWRWASQLITRSRDDWERQTDGQTWGLWRAFINENCIFPCQIKLLTIFLHFRKWLICIPNKHYLLKNMRKIEMQRRLSVGSGFDGWGYNLLCTKDPMVNNVSINNHKVKNNSPKPSDFTQI